MGCYIVIGNIYQEMSEINIYFYFFHIYGCFKILDGSSSKTKKTEQNLPTVRIIEGKRRIFYNIFHIVGVLTRGLTYSLAHELVCL